jgi:hypothetical protein
MSYGSPCNHLVKGPGLCLLGPPFTGSRLLSCRMQRLKLPLGCGCVGHESPSSAEHSRPADWHPLAIQAYDLPIPGIPRGMGPRRHTSIHLNSVDLVSLACAWGTSGVGTRLHMTSVLHDNLNPFPTRVHAVPSTNFPKRMHPPSVEALGYRILLCFYSSMADAWMAWQRDRHYLHQLHRTLPISAPPQWYVNDNISLTSLFGSRAGWPVLSRAGSTSHPMMYRNPGGLQTLTGSKENREHPMESMESRRTAQDRRNMFAAAKRKLCLSTFPRFSA